QPITRELRLTFFASIIFGGLTLLFRDQLFIQWKPTIVNGLLALSLFGSHFVGEQTLVQRLLGRQLELPGAVWARLNFGWACGFALAAGLNLVVAYNFSMDVWVTYKLVGGFALTFSYIIATVGYLAYKGFLKDAPDAAVDAGKAP
ncbi:MAG: septation protein IspZ, partial [Gammaproteobacteria bacterium]